MGVSDSSSGILPYLSLVGAQLITSSWHVLGKHVMSQVPYLTPIAFVLARTSVTACMLLVVGRVYEGRVSFPPLFYVEGAISNGPDEEEFTDEKKLENVENGKAGEELLFKKVEEKSMNGNFNSNNSRSIKRTKRMESTWNGQLNLLRVFVLNIRHHKDSTNRRKLATFNPEIIQIIGASLAGMLLLPLCYTTGLILTNPTVASVWDGPMIPLGVFFTAVGLGVEKLSRKRPCGQVMSLLLTVGGSIIVLLVDFLGAHNSITDEDGATIGHASHWQFIRGNIVLMGIAGAYAATSLLQKQLTHYPPVTLTAWMFAAGFMSSCCLLAFESVLQNLRGATITGCTLGQAISQLSIAINTSPTFRYGLVYASFFVGGACFSIMSYASSHLDASIITLFAAIQPPITAVLEWIWEGKELGMKKISGMICVGLGMLCFTHIKKADHNHHRHKKSSLNGHQKKRSR